MRVLCIAASPKFIAEDDDTRSARIFLLIRERSSHKRSNTEGRKQTCANSISGDMLRPLFTREIEAIGMVTGNTRKCAGAIAICTELRRRRTEKPFTHFRLTLPDSNKSFCIRIRERLE